MNTQHSNVRNERGEWRPVDRITLPPVYAWPPRPSSVAKWFFGFPGYLWPMNSLTLCITLVTWLFLTPPLEAMKTLEAWWVMLILLRNLALCLVFIGGLHLYLYVFKKQGDNLKFSNRPLATNNERFLFGNQVHDNMLRTLCGAVPVITVFEALSYWLFANNTIGFLPLAADTPAYWAWCGALLLVAPLIHAAHFYFIHRLLHWKPLYRTVHRIHHYNVEVGPWSALAMHPIELALYFSTVCVQWGLALHPLNALYQIQIAIFNAAVSHAGFDKVMIGSSISIESNNFFHYLHHKYFECNYGSTLAPMDQLFGTFHDGSDEARIGMRERMRSR